MALEEKKQFSDLINAAMFIAIIFIVGGSTFLMPKQSISTYEKRELAKFPALNKESFFSGSYFKDIDAYYADNFMFRISITEIDKEIKSAFDEYNARFDIIADEIGSLKDMLLKLQAYTMDVNKTLMEERIRILSDEPTPLEKALNAVDNNM
jgi:hypothetical protein